MHKGKLTNVNPPRITTEPQKLHRLLEKDFVLFKKEQDVLRKDQGLFFKTLFSEFSRRFNALIEF